MAADPEPSYDDSPIPPDPRKFIQIPAYLLVVDKRLQRLADMERVNQMMLEFDWLKMEAPSVVAIPDTDPQKYRVIEGQHRVLTVQNLDINALIWCCVEPEWVAETDQARLGHDISKSRRKHDPLELWNQRLKSQDQHEVLATQTLEKRGLRLGKSKSPTTIISINTVKFIVHGGGHTPEFGAEVLGDVLDVINSAWPEYDRESNVNRWDANLLRVVNSFFLDYGDLLDRDRLVEKLRVRTVKSWKHDAAMHRPVFAALYGAIKAEYNSGLRRRRLP